MFPTKDPPSIMLLAADGQRLCLCLPLHLRLENCLLNWNEIPNAEREKKILYVFRESATPDLKI